MKHLVALSGGKDSSAMAVRLVEAEPRDYEFCITPTGRELPEMVEHWNRLECLLKSPIVRVPGPTLMELIVKGRMIPNHRMRFCTRLVKIEPFIDYATANIPATCYVGIRADEAGDREGTNWNGIEGVVQDLPLVRWGWGESHVLDYLDRRGIVIPERTDCDFCYHQRLGEWWRLWKNHPDKFNEGVALETWTGHTFRSEERDSWPAALKDLGKCFEKGLIPKGANQLNLLGMAQRTAMCAWCAR